MQMRQFCGRGVVSCCETLPPHGPPDHPLILLPGHWESSHPCGTPVIERLKKTVEVKSTLHGADSLSPFAELPSKAEGRKLLQDKE